MLIPLRLRLARIEVLPASTAMAPSITTLVLKNVARVELSSMFLEGTLEVAIESSQGLATISLADCKNSCVLDLTECQVANRAGEIRFRQDCTRLHTSPATQTKSASRPYGPMLRILSSPGSLILVTGSKASAERSKSIAARLAHDLLVYHRMDAVIMSDFEALPLIAKGRLGRNNLVSIGQMEGNVVTQYILAESASPRSSALPPSASSANAGHCSAPPPQRAL